MKEVRITSEEAIAMGKAVGGNMEKLSDELYHAHNMIRTMRDVLELCGTELQKCGVSGGPQIAISITIAASKDIVK